jgi:intracellular multiplication protein IcmE
MSEYQNTDETVDIPAGESMAGDGTSAGKRGGMKTSTKITLIGGAAALAIAAAMAMGSAPTSGPSRAARPPALDATPGGAVQQENIRFQESLRQANDERGLAARETGTTFMPTPEGVLTSVQKVEPIEVETVEAVIAEPETEAEPQVVRRKIPPPASITRIDVPEDRSEQERQAISVPKGTAVSGDANAQEEEENPYTKAMLGQMNSATRAMEMPLAELTEGVEPTGRSGGSSGGGSSAGAETGGLAALAALAGGGSGEGSGAGVMLRPGDIIYGETLTAVDSDAQSPVIVEVTTGELKGARLVGGFEMSQNSNRLVVSFNSMTLEDGKTIGINGFAVDGKTAETAVASDVDRRYVSRYAPIFASAFISAYAQSASRPEQTLTEDGDVVVGQSSTEESMIAGAGAGMEAIAADISARAPKGPLVKLRDGYPIAIIVLDPVDNPS